MKRCDGCDSEQPDVVAVEAIGTAYDAWMAKLSAHKAQSVLCNAPGPAGAPS